MPFSIGDKIKFSQSFCKREYGLLCCNGRVPKNLHVGEVTNILLKMKRCVVEWNCGEISSPVFSIIIKTHLNINEVYLNAF